MKPTFFQHLYFFVITPNLANAARKFANCVFLISNLSVGRAVGSRRTCDLALAAPSPLHPQALSFYINPRRLLTGDEVDIPSPTSAVQEIQSHGRFGRP